MAQMRAERQLPTTMQDWIGFMSSYLDLNGFPILEGLGKISKEKANQKAFAEFEEFRIKQDREYLSDFEKLIALEKK